MRLTEGKIFIYSGFGNVIALQIILRNEFLGSNNVFKVKNTLNKVWLIFILKGMPIEKSSISKINVACSNTKLFSLYYEPWHTRNRDIKNPWHIQNPGIFRSPTVFTFLSNILYGLLIKVPGYNYFL